MSQVIPEGWVETSLGKLSSDISYGYTAKSTSLAVGPQMLRITDIQNNRVNWSSVPYCEIDVDLKAKYLLERGDLLFARTGATVGKSFLIREDIPESVYASYLIRVRCFPSAHIDYLSYFFLGPDYWDQITDMSSGIGQPSVNGTKLKGLALPLPPLAEQKVIADKLDALLAQVESTKARLDAIPAILKSFRQSLLAAAVSGKLTEDWRGDKNLLLELSEDKLANVIDEMRNGLSAKPNEKGLGYPILRISSVRSLFVDQVDIRFLELEPKTLEMYSLKLNDLLFTRYNGSLDYVGVCGQIKSLDHDHLVYPDKLIRVRVNNNKILANYLELYSASTEVRDFIKSLVKSTSGQKGISGKDLKDMLIKYPPILEQTEIVRRVEELFAFADKVEAQVNAAQTRVNNLTQSILAKAFRGELTQDWRAANPELISGENSASALLKRIKAERETLSVKKKPAKKAKA